MNEMQKLLLEYTDKQLEHKKTMYHIGCNLAHRLRLKLISKRTFDRMWEKMRWLSVNLAAIEFKSDVLTITINDSNFCHKYNIIKTINTAYDYAIKHSKKENKQ